MNKLLIICGPTATGKTELALTLAQKYHGDLISADSRQVYKHMDIGTGKDIPKDFRLQTSDFRLKNRPVTYYSDGKVNLWGLDLVNPDEPFSVADYTRFAIPLIQHFWQQQKLPIVVGGTGLYIRALTKQIPTINVPQNKKIRKSMGGFTVPQLQHALINLDPDRFNGMNHSDQHNPRRLMRAIEIAVWKRHMMNRTVRPEATSESGFWISQNDVLPVGLTAPQEILKQRIDNRVEQRIQHGIIDEVKKLLDAGYKWDLPAMSGLGYRRWEEYFEAFSVKHLASSEKKELEEKIVEKWKKDEYQYAKRQLTWFKKEEHIRWFDITTPDYPKSVLNAVERWYTKLSKLVVRSS